MSVKVAKHHSVFSVHHKGVKVGGRSTLGDIHVDKNQCSPPPPRSASTARTSAVSMWALLLGGK